MKILFMGTTDFAEACLDSIVKAGYSVCAVCTKPDRPQKRGMKMISPPVKEYALKAGLPVLQPATLKEQEVQEQLAAYGADLFVVVAYGHLLPKAVLDMPKMGCINVHGSLLPKLRGAAPIQWAVLNGLKETGVSTMFLNEGMDSGPVIDTVSLVLEEYEPFGSVYERLKALGAQLLAETLEKLEQGSAQVTAQDESEATYAPPITKAHCAVDWNREPEAIAAQLCGLDPKPGATADFGGTVFKLFAPRYTDTVTELAPGSIVNQSKLGLEVACGGGRTLMITQLQAPGGKRMRAADYLRGHSIP